MCLCLCLCLPCIQRGDSRASIKCSRSGYFERKAQRATPGLHRQFVMIVSTKSLFVFILKFTVLVRLTCTVSSWAGEDHQTRPTTCSPPSGLVLLHASSVRARTKCVSGFACCNVCVCVCVRARVCVHACVRASVNCVRTQVGELVGACACAGCCCNAAVMSARDEHDSGIARR